LQGRGEPAVPDRFAGRPATAGQPTDGLLPGGGQHDWFLVVGWSTDGPVAGAADGGRAAGSVGRLTGGSNVAAGTRQTIWKTRPRRRARPRWRRGSTFTPWRNFSRGVTTGRTTEAAAPRSKPDSAHPRDRRRAAGPDTRPGFFAVPRYPFAKPRSGALQSSSSPYTTVRAGR